MNRIGLNWSLLYSKKITESELRVFLVMKDRAYCVSKDCEKPFYVTVGWIATNTGLHTNTVKAAIKSLKDMKLIGTNGRVRKYGVVQNEWTINWPLIEKDDKHHKFVNEEVDVDIDIIPAPEEDCALKPTEIAKNEVCMQQFELDPIVDGEIDEDDCRYKEYMAGLNKDKTKEDEDMIEQKVIDRFKDIRYNSPEYWRMMREVVDPLPNCQKDNVIKELNEYFRAA